MVTQGDRNIPPPLTARDSLKRERERGLSSPLSFENLQITKGGFLGIRTSGKAWALELNSIELLISLRYRGGDNETAIDGFHIGIGHRGERLA